MNYRLAFFRYHLIHGLMLVLLCGLLVSQFAADEPAPSQSPTQPVSAITLTTQKATLRYRLFDTIFHVPMPGFNFAGQTGEKNPTIFVCPGEALTITVRNGDGFSHLLAIVEAGQASQLLATKGEHDTIAFTPVAGTQYAYSCPVAFHSTFGMSGTIVVLDC
jgi:plastocyanin